ncbi:hypothetical protein DFH07DRAFT_141143 [Mycena maculata]|uniref:MYND-type domain-containing protein n=1 Tax=Mycena maculata TaxID=230809 RepID=A0AAD7I1Q7_9AGAR|nr:hypothetical protein DFH07DRAFT_141143 [Mycena maculata]
MTLSSTKLTLLEDVLYIVMSVDGIGEADESPPETSKPLCLALISRGFVKSLTVAAGALACTTTPDPANAVAKCTFLFGAVFLTQRGYRELRVGVQHGILQTIYAFGQRDLSDDDTPRNLAFFLSEILTPATVYYYVLADSWTAYFAVANNDRSGSPPSPEFSEAWAGFVTTLLERIDVLRRFDSKDHVSRRACDNVKCGIIMDKAGLRCCAGCNELFYCSRECQGLDWRRGHRDYCAVYRLRHTSEPTSVHENPDFNQFDQPSV